MCGPKIFDCISCGQVQTKTKVNHRADHEWPFDALSTGSLLSREFERAPWIRLPKVSPWPKPIVRIFTFLKFVSPGEELFADCPVAAVISENEAGGKPMHGLSEFLRAVVL